MRAAPALLLAALLAACGGKVPPTRYYQLAAPPPAAAPVVAVADAAPKPAAPAAPAGDAQGGPLLVLEPLAADEAYQDERIVYRTGPYRLDYYQYHLWSAPPGVMVTDYLEQALERSGRFRAIVRELTPGAPVVLGGRLVALEEVDESRTRWIGRVVLELTLEDAETSAVLWSAQLTETEPLTAQSRRASPRRCRRRWRASPRA